MKKHTLKSILSVASFLVLPLQVSALNVAVGDLLLGFYQVNQTVVGTNTYVYNLGPASGWRTTTANTTLIANLNSDLTTAFSDANWAENDQLKMLIVGVVGAGEPTIGGDPSRTIYFSSTTNPTDTATLQSWSWGTNLRGSVALNIDTFSDGANGEPSTNVLPAAAIMASSSNNSLTSYTPPTVGGFFGAGITASTSLGVGNLGKMGNYDVEAKLNVYRILHTTTGATLTAHKSPTNAVLGRPQFIGSFTLATNGDLRYDVEAAPPTSPYNTWTQQNNLSGANAGFTADPDMDGLNNGIEFVVGGNPNSNVDATKRPTVKIENGQLVFQFRRTDASSTLNPVAQYDNDLLGVWSTASNGSSGVAVSTEADFFDATTDRITVIIPVSGPRMFARLAVPQPQ